MTQGQYRRMEFLIPMPSSGEGLSEKDVAKFQALMHDALVALAERLEASTDFDCTPTVRLALAAGLRGEHARRRDA